MKMWQYLMILLPFFIIILQYFGFVPVKFGAIPRTVIAFFVSIAIFVGFLFFRAQYGESIDDTLACIVFDCPKIKDVNHQAEIRSDPFQSKTDFLDRDKRTYFDKTQSPKFPFQAERKWYYVGKYAAFRDKNDISSTFVDKNSITDAFDGKFFVESAEYIKVPNDLSISTVISRDIIDCSNFTFARIQSAALKKNGQFEGAFSGDRKFEKVSNGGSYSQVFKFVCQGLSGKPAIETDFGNF